MEGIVLIKRKAIVVAGILLVLSQPHYVLSAEQLDRYGGSLRVFGQRAESFHLEKIANRWWLATPEGHGIFVWAVSKVDTSDYGGSGGFLAYDGVYLQTAAGAISGNLRTAAENSLTRDVVQPGAKVTLKSKGDVFYLGSSRFKPNYSYFWLEQPGEGGKLLWYYSTADGWKPIRNSGKPYKGAALNEDGSFILDIPPAVTYNGITVTNTRYVGSCCLDVACVPRAAQLLAATEEADDEGDRRCAGPSQASLSALR
jgi:hypothetical protein